MRLKCTVHWGKLPQANVGGTRTWQAKSLGDSLRRWSRPLLDDGSVNYDQLGRLAQQLIAGGSDALLVTGTTGESPTLSHEEKLECYRTVMQAADGRAPVIAGTGNYNTAESAAFSREAEALGVDGLLLVVPYYNNPPQEGLYQHFKTIADSTSLPCIVYNVPTRTVRNMDATTTARLAEVDNIVGVKEASGDLGQISDVLRLTPDDFRVWSGNDSDTYHIMCMGGFGIISVASHVIGLQIKKMINATLDSDIPTAGALHQQLMPLFTSIFPAHFTGRQPGRHQGLPQPLRLQRRRPPPAPDPRALNTFAHTLRESARHLRTGPEPVGPGNGIGGTRTA